MPNLTDLANVPTIVWVIGGVVALGIFVGAVKAIRALRRRPLEDILTVIAAGIATAVSASGMWQFFERIMPDVPWYWRVAMFAFIEVAVINSAVRAKRSMKEKYSAGVDGIAVWVLTCLSAVLSALEAASLPEALFRLAAPLVAAWLWERGMAIERHRITGLSGINWSITPERLLVRLGLAEARDRTTSEVAIQRHLTRVALTAIRARELAEASASTRKQASAHKKLRTALERAEEHTDLATNPITQRILLDKAITLRAGTGLTQLPDVLPWTGLDHPAVTGARRNSEAVVLAEETRRLTDAILAKGDPEASAAVTSMAAFITGSHVMPTAPVNGRTISPIPPTEFPPPSPEGRSWLSSLKTFVIDRPQVMDTAEGESSSAEPVAVPAVPAGPPAKMPVLTPAPDELFPVAADRYADEIATGVAPTLTRIKKDLNVGQPRAVKIRLYLDQLART